MFYAFTAFAVAFYLIAGWMLWRRLARRSTSEAKTPLLIGLAAAILHTVILYHNIATGNGVNLGFTNTVSLAMAFIALTLILSAFSRPVENLGIVILPLAAFSLLLEYIFPTMHTFTHTHSLGLGIHIFFSILAYSLLSLAAVQAVLLAIQDRHLHNRQPGGIIRALPPLETMEGLMFQMILGGFLLQSISLATGIVYLEDWFGQHLVHKTVLSIVAWVVFATLLWGHWRYGWRGRIAIRWTLTGFFTLLLAYFGSKYVLEILLGR